MRKLIADTVALLLFSTAAGLVAEVLVARMALSDSLQARVAAVPVILLTARPYGIYRDWLMEKTGADAGRLWKRTATDIAAFVSFQVPVYAAILFFAGASPQQIIAACATAIVILAISGRPYGLFLELCRTIMRAPD